MVLGWLFGENNRQPLDNLHYVRDAPRDTHGTEELRPMMRWRDDVENFFKHWECVAQNVVRSGEGLKYDEE